MGVALCELAAQQFSMVPMPRVVQKCARQFEGSMHNSCNFPVSIVRLNRHMVKLYLLGTPRVMMDIDNFVSTHSLIFSKST